MTRAGWGGVTLLLLVALSIQGMSASAARGAQDSTGQSRAVHCDAVQVAARMMKVRREGRSEAVRPARCTGPRFARVVDPREVTPTGVALAPVPMLRDSLLALPPPSR